LSGVPSQARTYTIMFRVRDANLAGATPPDRAYATLKVIIVA
jgi:hypothetical protein